MTGNDLNNLLVQLISQLENMGLTGGGLHSSINSNVNVTGRTHISFVPNTTHVDTISPPSFQPQAHGTISHFGPTTGASSHLNSSITSLNDVFNMCMYPSISVRDGPSLIRAIFIRDNNCAIEFDAFGFTVKDFMTRQVLLRCDSTGDLYSVTPPSLIPHVFLVSQHTWHQRLSHPGSEVLRRLVSNNFIWCNKEKPPVHCHACQLGKHYLEDDTLSCYKARLVANGSTQLEWVDVDGTFSPLVKPGTIQTVLCLAASRHWPIHQLDVKNAFLHGDLSETVYMYHPSGFRDSAHPDYVCLLQRSLYGHGTDTAYFLLYVDDIVLTASSEGLLQKIIRSLNLGFAMIDLGPLNYFLGISVTRDSSVLFLSQKKYAVEILEKAHMVNCNPSRTPVDNESKLGVDGDPVSDPTLYRSLAGSLHDLTFTRPDISYAGTLNYGLQLFSLSTTDLVAYSDADWAGCPTTRRSNLGAEAEYRGVANAVAETCWLRNLLRKLHTPLSTAMLVYCDNGSVVYLSSNPIQHQRMKHIEIDIHFFRDLVAADQVRVLHVPSRYQFADIFTIGLPSTIFEEFRSSLSV
ncbi:ribonuclease H-like domain-containing protein [Tanacetum coccineum]